MKARGMKEVTEWLTVVLCLLQWLTLAHAKGYVFFRDGYNSIGENGSWTRWFNGDNPYIFDPNAPGGDIETITQEKRIYGHHCDWGVACPDPIGFEVDLSHYWRITYPNATMTECLKCSNIYPEALTTVGKFQCSNLAQLNKVWVRHLSKDCLDYCKKSGQMYLGITDPQFAQDVQPNCYICPDFAIRFFCLETQKDCLSKEEWWDMLAEIGK